MKANFFELEIKTSVILKRYTIKLEAFVKKWNNGKEVGREIPKNRDVKRALITSLLKSKEESPMHDNWVTDYESTIISVGDLYKENDTRCSIAIPHTRIDGKGDKVDTTSTVEFRDVVPLQSLVDFVEKGPLSGPGNTSAYDDPSEELKALNMISWMYINDDESFQGGRKGKKFYPKNLVAEELDEDPLYKIRRGFFTSVRIGQDALFLNINTTTSAIYAPVLVSEWMASFSKMNDRENCTDPNTFEKLLKGVEVTFIAAGVKLPGRKFSIFGISTNRINTKTFEKKNKDPKSKTTSKSTVLQYLRNGCIPPIH